MPVSGLMNPRVHEGSIRAGILGAVGRSTVLLHPASRWGKAFGSLLVAVSSPESLLALVVAVVLVIVVVMVVVFVVVVKVLYQTLSLFGHPCWHNLGRLKAVGLSENPLRQRSKCSAHTSQPVYINYSTRLLALARTDSNS